ncbi:universal stress protein [Cellulosimicrobium cellulans]|uniref:UspA domain-containing protein n=1 Tax=Cellulosimicrobium cellulans TaxID=1710 RepID=A0A4Y4DXB0_CELCE|nr:universal stress protein [Cellulosimicrobium cellulans]GED08434.1 hypothetical protein CCE02nite_04330 [Cellulosimicrobium cellulans]
MPAEWSRGVVVGFDGSPGSIHALEWAADAADRHRSALHVQFVLEPAGRGERHDLFDEGYHAGRVLDLAMDVLAEFRPGLHDVSASVVRGMLLPSLLASSRAADLLVLGGSGTTRSSGPPGSRPRASVSARVARRAHGAVAVVPRGCPSRPGGRVVVGVAGANDAPAIEVAFREAQESHAVTVVHVLEHVGALQAADGCGYLRWWRWSAFSQLWSVSERCADRYGVDRGMLVLSGCAASQLAGQVGPEDVLVLGSPAGSGSKGAAPVLSTVLRSVGCPVLVAGRGSARVERRDSAGVEAAADERRTVRPSLSVPLGDADRNLRSRRSGTRAQPGTRTSEPLARPERSASSASGAWSRG